MANVHGFRDLNNNNNNNNNNRNRNFQQYYQQGDQDQDANYQQMNNLQNIPLLNFSVGGQDKDPRKETIFDMCKYYCCPTINIKQFIVIITIIDTLVFTISLILSLTGYYGKPILNQEYFLGPNIVTLYNFGAKCRYQMQYHYQLWRFVTPCFLHSGFLHIISNMFFQIIFGVGLESTIGYGRIIAIYFVSGIGGNLFSALVTEDMSVGASTCLFGILIAYLSYLILNWEDLEPLGMTRYCMACMIIMIVFLNFLYDLGGVSVTDNSNNQNSQGQGVTDYFGHLGGLITGAFISLAIIRPMSPNRQKNKILKWIGASLCSAFFIICFLCFFLIKRAAPLPGPSGIQC